MAGLRSCFLETTARNGGIPNLEQKSEVHLYKLIWQCWAHGFLWVNTSDFLLHLCLATGFIPLGRHFVAGSRWQTLECVC